MGVYLSAEDIRLYSLTETGKAYLEYHRAIGGKPFGYTVGMPVEAYETVERCGGIAELYRECIRQGKTWESLTGWSGHSDEIPKDHFTEVQEGKKT